MVSGRVGGSVRVLVYGLMALALSLAGVLMGVHHSGGEGHAVPHAVSQSVLPHSAADHSESATMTDSHNDGVSEPCVTCGHDDSSMFLMACAFLAVVISLAALVHPARVMGPARTDQPSRFRARPPDDSGVPVGVDLDELCVSRR